MKKLLTIILTLCMFTSFSVFTNASAQTQKLPHEAIAEFASEGTVLISPDDFTALSSSGMISRFDPTTDYMSVSAVNTDAADKMVFDKAVKLSCHTAPASWIHASVRVNFNTGSAQYK